MINDGLEDTPESNAQLAAITRSLNSAQSPKVLRPGHPDNEADADKKAMESLFAALEERGVHSPKKLSEFEVYSRLEEYGKRAKKE